MSGSDLSQFGSTELNIAVPVWLSISLKSLSVHAEKKKRSQYFPGNCQAAEFNVFVSVFSSECLCLSISGLDFKSEYFDIKV